MLQLLMVILLPLGFLWGEEDPAWAHATIAAYAINTRTGEVIVDLCGDKSFFPGSCLKIVTTGAALHLLGAESYFQTDLEIEGEIKEGVLHGNLLIRGGGDPCLGSNRVASSLSWEEQIKAWVQAAEKLGIKEIRGDVIGDSSQWEEAQAVPSWAWEDLGNYYGAGASALSFHENNYSLFFKPGEKEGDEAILSRVVPAIPKMLLRNEVKTGAVGSGDQACIYGSELSTIQLVRGTIPAGVAEFSIRGSIPDPAAFCSELLTQALEEKGIKVSHHSLPRNQKRAVIHSTRSPKIKEIIYWANQKSLNLYAEHLLKSIGEKMEGEGSTSAGTRAVVKFWQGQGVDVHGLNMMDGSGLSRKNFITPKQLVSILVKMKQSPDFPLFFDSLPEMNGGVRAKSGSMSFLRGCAGYKGEIAFAILINQGPDQKKMREKVNLFLYDL